MFPVGRANVGTFAGRPERALDPRRQLIHERCPQLEVGTELLCNLLVQTDNRPGNPRFPWITPVLGSGTTTGLNPIQVVSELARAVIATLPEARQREVAAGFATALIKQRLAVADLVIEPPAFDHSTDVAEAGALLLATGWLTKAYHHLKSYETPVAGGLVDPAATLDPELPEADEVGDTFIDPTRDALSMAERAVDATVNQRASLVLRKASQALSPPEGQLITIELTKIRDLTEYTWRKISESLYPGWSDLLWDLFMRTHAWPSDDARRGPRPLSMALDHAARTVARKLHDRTTAAWAPVAGPDARSSDLELYDAVAQVLVAQAQLYGAVKDPVRPPSVSAFVTTFDLELEMSLLRQHQPFVMAVPLNVVVGSTRALVWAGCRVDAGPEPAIDSVRKPAPESWFLLSNLKEFREQPFAGLPFVVRITGSPLVDCPDPKKAVDLSAGVKKLLAATPGLAWDSGVLDGESMLLSHALLLDEYVAMDQSAALLKRVPSPTREPKYDVDYRLPEQITSSMARTGYNRFWMMFGVQMGDAAIRHSIAMQLALSNAPKQPERNPPLRNGVAIQSRVTGEAEDLLQQIGLDVVQSDAALFVDDLRHYRDHVAAASEQLGSPTPPPRAGGAGFFPENANSDCRLGEDG